MFQVLDEGEPNAKKIPLLLMLRGTPVIRAGLPHPLAGRRGRDVLKDVS